MPRIATIDRMVGAIEESRKPALTKQDIADALDVSWQTIHNHEEELKADPRVETDTIGRAEVYWLADEPNTDLLGERPSEGGDSEREPPKYGEESESPPEGRPGARWSIRELLEDVTNNLATLTFIAAIALLVETFVVDIPYVSVFMLGLTVFAGIVSTSIMVLVLYSDLPTRAEAPIERLVIQLGRIAARAARRIA